MFLRAGAFYGIIGDNPHIQTIGGDDIGLPPQQHRGFLAGDGADGGKNVRFAGAGPLKRPLGRDVQGCGLVGGVDAAQVGIDIPPGSGHGAPEHGGVGSEHRAYAGRQFFERKQASAAHPFVEQGNAASFKGFDPAFINGRNNRTASRGEHDGFNIVPPAGKRIHTVIFPQIVQKLVAGIPLGKIHQNGLGATGNIPAAHAAFEILCGKCQAKRIPYILVRFFKTHIFSQGRAKEKIVLAKLLYSLQCLAADHRVDAPHLVADFPTDLKQRDGGVIEIHAFSLWKGRLA